MKHVKFFFLRVLIKIIPLTFAFLFFQCITIGQQKWITLSNVCAFDEAPKTEYSLTNSSTLEHFIQKIISSTGFSGDRINISSSSLIKYAVTGLRTDGNTEIVVNNNFNPDEESWYNKIVVTHEIAHIFNRDIYGEMCASIANELKADYFAGFWAGRNSGPLDSAQAPFKNFPYDTSHPVNADRLKAVDSGWHKAKELNFLNNIVATSDAAKYAKDINLYFTVTNNPKISYASGKYKVYFHLASRDMKNPFDSIATKIDRVSYILHKTFRRRLVTSLNVNDDAFGYTLTRVWGTFPIVCLIYFTDESVLPIVKEFSLDAKSIHK